MRVSSTDLNHANRRFSIKIVAPNNGARRVQNKAKCTKPLLVAFTYSNQCARAVIINSPARSSVMLGMSINSSMDCSANVSLSQISLLAN